MNKKKLAILIVCVLSVGAISYSWNPFKKSDWEKLGKEIKSGFDQISDWAEGAGKKFLKKVDKAKSCLEVVTLGTEWAAKRAAYEIAKKTLELSRSLQDADPRRIALKTQIATLEAKKATLHASQQALSGTKKAAEVGLDVTNKLAEVTGDFTTFLSKAAELITVDHAGFASGFQEIKKGNVLELTLKGSFANKSFAIDKAELNVKDLAGSIESFVTSIISRISGGKVTKEDLNKIESQTLVPDASAAQIIAQEPQAATKTITSPDVSVERQIVSLQKTVEVYKKIKDNNARKFAELTVKISQSVSNPDLLKQYSAERDEVSKLMQDVDKTIGDMETSIKQLQALQ